MTLDAQEVIGNTFKGILGSLLDRVPWDPAFGASQATAASDFDNAADVCEEVLEFVTDYLSNLRRRRNEELASTKSLPPELLIHVWKYATPKSANYYKALGPLRLTSTRWMRIIDNDPSFWTILSCGNSWQQARKSLKRSGALPLDVYFPCRDACPVKFEDEDDDGTEWTHGHWRFLDVLQPELHRVRSANIIPYFSDWEDMLDLFAAGASQMSTLHIDGDNPSDDRSLLLRRDFLEGIAPALQIIHLINGYIPTDSPYHFHFPALHDLTISDSFLSASQALQLLAASPTLARLSIEDCLVRESAEIPPTVLQSHLRHLRIRGNRPAYAPEGFDSIGLINLIDYISSPHIESFLIRQDQFVDVELQSLGDWLAAVSERCPATSLRLWAEIDSESMALKYGPNCSADVIVPQITSVSALVLGLVDRIHPSAVPSLTRINIDIDDSYLSTILPELALRFPNITHLIMSDYFPLSWSVLGCAKASIFQSLEVLGLYNTGEESETALISLLKTRSSPEVENSGWKALKGVILRGVLSHSLLESVAALELDVKAPARWSNV